MKKGALLHLAGCISVQAKFLLILFLALVVVAGACFFSSRLPYAAYDVQLHNANVQTLALFADKIESELEGFSQLSLQILGDNVIQKNLSVMARSSPERKDWIEAKRLIDDHFYSFTQTRKNARALYIQLDGSNTRFSFVRGGNRINELSTGTIDLAIQAAHAAEGRPAWMGVAGASPSLLLVRDIREIQNLTLHSLATIIIDADLAQIVNSCQAKMATLSATLSTAIYDGDLCLYASDDTIAQIHMDSDGYDVIRLNGRELLCTRVTSSQGWQMISALPYDEIMADVRQTARQSLLIAAIATTMALVCGGVLIASVLRHLDVLLQKFDAFAQGHAPAEKDEAYQDRRDEIGRLHRHFDRMARDYDRVVRDNYEKRLFIQEAQTRQLKAQIRPHFLYNTLQSIYCMAQADGQTQIAAMTDALGKMLHASLSDPRDLVPVRDDYVIAREYMRIQLLRYGGRLQLSYEIPPALEQVLVPAMTLQPLVENAVQHAAEEMTEPCLIRVYALHSGEGGVDIVVEDNGPGMDERIIEKLESGEIKPDGLGIGIRNIHRRIQLSFSSDFGLRIRREEGRTRVYIHVPDTSIKEEETHVQAAVGG